MKTIRSIIVTLAAILLTYAVIAWVAVRRNAAFLQRTIYQGFDQTFVVALVMGCAFLLISIILTVAILSTRDEEEDEEELIPRRKPQSRPQPNRSAPPRAAQPYRKASRSARMAELEEDERDDLEELVFRSRPVKPAPAARRTAPAASSADIPLRRGEVRPAAPRPAQKPKAQAPRERLQEADVQPKATPQRARQAAEAPRARVPRERPIPEEERPNARSSGADPVIEKEAPARAMAKAPAKAAGLVEDGSTSQPEAAAIAPQEEATVRCVFCGSVISRDSLFCPRCGKKL